jgi:formate dehydrogenase alpha subunit
MMVGPVLFHSGKLSTHAKGLMEIQSDGRLLMNPTDAQRLGIASGDWVKLKAAAGEAEVPVTILGRIPEGMLYFPESFRTPLAHVLSLTVDPMTGVAYTKLQHVTVRKLPVTATSVSES